MALITSGCAPCRCTHLGGRPCDGVAEMPSAPAGSNCHCCADTALPAAPCSQPHSLPAATPYTYTSTAGEDRSRCSWLLGACPGRTVAVAISSLSHAGGDFLALYGSAGEVLAQLNSSHTRKFRHLRYGSAPAHGQGFVAAAGAAPPILLTGPGAVELVLR